MNGGGGGGDVIEPHLPGESAQQPGLQRLSLGLSRKEILQAGPSQASPAGPSSLTPCWVSGHTSLGSLGLQHLQQLGQPRWPDVRFCQRQGREKGSEMPGEGEGNWRQITQRASLPSPAEGHHSWQHLAKPRNLSIPWVMVSLLLPLGETASPQLS